MRILDNGEIKSTKSVDYYLISLRSPNMIDSYPYITNDFEHMIQYVIKMRDEIDDKQTLVVWRESLLEVTT